MSFKCFLGIVALAGVLLLPPGRRSKADAEVLKFPLEQVEVEAGTLRLGRGVKGRIPKKALALRDEAGTYLFLDLNGDRRITGKGRDGLTLEGYSFVVSLPDVLLLPVGQGRWEVREEQLFLSREEPPCDENTLKEAATLTELRIRAGLSPVPVDAAATRACMAHLDYLKRHDQTSGMKMHHEEQGKEGYTPEGARAGRAASLFPTVPSLRAAMRFWYGTVWHAWPMFSEQLRSVGVAYRHGMAMLYFQLDGVPSRPFPHPADGAVRVPRTFGPRGEIPNPTPHRKSPIGCGFPILVRLPNHLRGRDLVVAEVTTDDDGESIEGTHSCPASPATKSWPSNSRLAAFIPEAPLAKDTEYRVRFEFEGVPKPITWRFTTGEKFEDEESRRRR